MDLSLRSLRSVIFAFFSIWIIGVAIIKVASLRLISRQHSLMSALLVLRTALDLESGIIGQSKLSLWPSLAVLRRQWILSKNGHLI